MSEEFPWLFPRPNSLHAEIEVKDARFCPFHVGGMDARSGFISRKLFVQQVSVLHTGKLLVRDGGWLYAVPCPLLLQCGIKVAIQHVDDVLPENRKELEPVEGSASRNVQSFTSGVWRNDEVLAGSDSVPGSVSSGAV